MTTDIDQIEQARMAMIESLQKATLAGNLDWIKTNPEEVKWKVGTLEQRYAMISSEGLFATLSRMMNGSMELIIQVQLEGCYREYEITIADGPVTQQALHQLYKSLPSTAKMAEDFWSIVHHLTGESQPS